MKFSANLSMLYPEHGFLERFGAAAADGFRGVEYVSPYEHPPEVLAALLERYGLTQALFNLPAGDWAAGERGLACLPGREAEFAAGIDTAITYAQALDCQQVNCLAGIVPAGQDRARCEAVLVANLALAAERLDEVGVKVLLGPINQRDMPGYAVSGTAQAEAIMARVGSDNLWLQYDFYHMQITQGDLLSNFERLQHRIAHVQVADVPGRHEPGTGEINYPNIFAALERHGYDGWIGAEYRPQAATSAGLGWMLPSFSP
ncbi:hydroxypyruvate isomerase [Devosia sp. A369]